MKTELDNKLCETYPKIFSQRHDDMKTTAMCWGFSCGDGWYNIVNNLCNLIQHRIDWSVKNHQYDVTNNSKTIRPVINQVVAVQVKEKFGGLRFYYEGGDEGIYGMVSMAEAMSECTCEECGSPATRGGTGWISTLCEPCRTARNKQYKFTDKDSGSHD